MNSELLEKVHTVLNSAKSVVYGQDNLLDSIMAAIVCEGHLLIEGMPGLGKTLSVSSVSKLCDLAFKRIQFTPDLLPSDLIGTMIYQQSKEEFTTKFGPIFTQILLADEINRSPAKVQAALLEAMAEQQVTIGENTHKLSNPFVVLATQNPIEQEGTYNLPEAQLDRFMMKVRVDYPDHNAEVSILDIKKNPTTALNAMIDLEEILEIQEEVSKIYVDDKIKNLIVRLVQATRPSNKIFLHELKGAVLSGASPRASIWLYKIAKYKAFLKGKEFVSPEEIFEIVPDVLGHRIILSYEASIDQMNTRDVALKIGNAII
jgi:MoxR-like ATPase